MVATVVVRPLQPPWNRSSHGGGDLDHHLDPVFPCSSTNTKGPSLIQSSIRAAHIKADRGTVVQPYQPSDRADADPDIHRPARRCRHIDHLHIRKVAQQPSARHRHPADLDLPILHKRSPGWSGRPHLAGFEPAV